MAANSQDIVSLCLVAHESPKWVSEQLFAEAFRILKPGGVFTMLDLDKDNLENLLENPFVAAVYKRTEPYMQEFLKLNPQVLFNACIPHQRVTLICFLYIHYSANSVLTNFDCYRLTWFMPGSKLPKLTMPLDPTKSSFPGNLMLSSFKPFKIFTNIET